MRKLFLLLVFLMTGWVGFWWAKDRTAPKPLVLQTQVEKEYPVTERKSFVVIVYAHNKAAWCEETLRSIFEQEYDYYRVIFIDDASTDRTFQTAKRFILESHQEPRVVLMRNEARLGPLICLSRAVESLLDREIAIPMDGKDWLSHSGVLTRLNQIYQNPDVWMASGDSLSYPLYQKQEGGVETFYASLFKQLPGDAEKNWIATLEGLSRGRVSRLKEPLLFSNETCPGVIPFIKSKV